MGVGDAWERWEVVGERWRQLYLNNNKKERDREGEKGRAGGRQNGVGEGNSNI